MQTTFSRSSVGPLHYWRTLALVAATALITGTVFGDVVAVLFVSIASAFVFSADEHRRWIRVPAQLRVIDVMLRLCLAFAATSAVATLV